MATMAPTRIQSRPEFADILREETSYAQPKPEGTKRASVDDRINGAFDRLMLQSGLGISPGMLLALCVCSAITLGGAMFVWQENLLTTGVACGVGAFIPLLYTMYARNKRQNTILNQMPDMVSELARAARTGRSLENCLNLVARDTPAPLGDELKNCTRKMAMGLSIPESMKGLPERTGVNSTNIFVMALTLHSETGGDLILVLERLANAIRDRISFLGRLRAATTASRATAVLMLVLPPAVVAFFIFRDPNYLTDLFSSSWGRSVTALAIFLQLAGSVWVMRILGNSKRT
ncbi:type II secretion system F family protein [Calycomorphotria hydatis]|uniref:Bacterial type II secretion system protein F domain protein n=1 Tax=Calycomorphotria hydatis TaxID=2528027 RepID=A0A517TAJ2_9PLAN|nr:type II secretion system F family protein [Calycomorphotria hydatis]QDT65383.1 Bacterial type II secretion system protein F domain protein [Calycomorphotria hydatis]